MWCRPDSGIAHPGDLEGRRVGVRAYSVTAGVWTRGIFVNEFGLDADRVTWVVDDEEHVLALPLPGNVVHAPAGTLGKLAAAGELDAGMAAAAGIGTPPSGWHDIVPDAGALEAAWFKRTKIYPIHSVIVIKDELLAKHRWLAAAVYRAFCDAKAVYLRRLADGSSSGAEDRRYQDLATLVGDPLPYGLDANRPAIETLIAYAARQHLIPAPMTADDVFLDPEAVHA
jgi:4,5-dihydroxyphthalate decarboxylase